MADTLGYPPGPNSFAVLHKMSNYEKRGRNDAAINLGKRWTEAQPGDGFNDNIFIGIAWLFLKKAQHDSPQADDYVHQALLYRDRALDVASDTSGIYSIEALRDLAFISTVAGDLSPKRRCRQYENAIKLLERRAAMLKEKQEEISRRFVPDKNDFTLEDVKCLSDENQAAIAQVRERQQSYACR
ncbi:MAG TPA: hypothetical protein VD837_02885 [Terriglobales bacterium]|nr:hypothetical protein [Terriglobales bacterium]